MQRMREQLDREAAAFGIDVVDVRIRRADLPEQNSQAVYQRMQTERQREAAEFRAQGSQRAQEIRARADRDVTVLIADATSRAEQIRGEGDGERNRIFAEAFGRDLGFLRLLPLDAGLGGGAAAQRHAHAAEARFRVLPLLHRSVGQAARGAPRSEAAGRQPAAALAGLPASRDVRGRWYAPMSDFLVALGLVFVLEGLMLGGVSGWPPKRAMAERPRDAGRHAADDRASFRRWSASWWYGCVRG